LTQDNRTSGIVGALARRAARSRPGRRLIEGLRSEQSEPSLDGWLTHYFDERLSELDAACAGLGAAGLELFRELDDDLWTVLLGRNYSSYPNVLALLPELPDASLQRRWNGTAGPLLMSQSKAFYARLKEQVAVHGQADLAGSSVLDFGCGWGRLTRFVARDVEAGRLFGCDPVEEILDVCRQTRVPATLARSEFVPERVPFRERFDLVFSFSVFTHLSERAHEACLQAIHAALKPGGLLITTVRPPAYLSVSEELAGLRESLGKDPIAALAAPRFLFAPHLPDPRHPQHQGPEMTYGEAVISLPYIRERWSPRFELVDTNVPTDDPFQVALTLRRSS
jgi:SAM-dependent methyltransferase